ncbi:MULTISPECIES: response regulator [Bacillus]|uniref:Response regulator transcription factor n=1 Tax=Bacillus glycinifermentans TaxID=1664069 RepID=A0AAJ3Z0B5_9BACI|nr:MULTISPECIES: response regulator transcription factor [Bacillus]KKB73059.1 chemotaxis protein CheY [Bacillus sp. TH008]MDU0070748.1 response regulator transcription factor [Bacillus sp. IG6]MED8018680.1 response regulator transcription factor [Bacillus glycinifermentans]QAT66168.1 response regulator transcription factor [Bacillus glycinifermentans]WKB75878.1 response regulator transcription factor [Bacillus glycinifermentans]
MRYKVLVVDDHFVVREGLKLILETSEDYEVCGEADGGEAALRLASELNPDVILMDLNMPKMSGLEAIKRLRDRDPGIPIIILTTYNEDDLMVQGLALGAKGYLLKDTSRENLFRTIESAIRGETLLQPEITDRIFAGKISESLSENNSVKAILTEKELFVLRSVAHGAKNKEIAFDLGISERTVKAYLTNIYNKLGVSSRSEAVAVAIERRILHL